MAPRTASKIQWLLERNDKYMRTPEGQQSYEALRRQVEENPKLDDLAPWIWREMKKQRLMATADGRGIFPVGQDAPYPFDLSHLADWYGSNSPTRRGVDIMQLDLNGVGDRLKAWDDELASKMDQERQMSGTIVHDFSDPDDPNHPRNGWTIRRVDSAQQAQDEGNAMGHCVGGYGHDIERGELGIFSLRDPKNQPHATIEIRPGEYPQHDYLEEDQPLLRPEGGRVHQIQGKQNGEPDPKYKDMLRDWFTSGIDLGHTADQPVTHVPIARTPEDLQYWWEPEPDDNYGQYGHYQINPYQAAEYGLDDDPEDEYQYEGPPQWDDIVHSLLHNSYHRGTPAYDTNDAENVRGIAHEAGQQDDLHAEAEKKRQELGAEFYNGVYDPNEYSGPPALQWNDWHKGQKMNTLMGLRGNTSSLPYDKDGIPLDQPRPSPPIQRDTWQPNFQPELDEQFAGERHGIPGGLWNRQDPAVFSKTADVEGYTNWDTFEAANLMHNNGEKNYNKVRKLVEQGYTPEQLRDWAIRTLLGPYNKQQLADTQNWNAIDPDERRRRMDESDRAQFGDEAVDLGRGILDAGGFHNDPGEDDTANVIDPEMVNWHELHQGIRNEFDEEAAYERMNQEKRNQGLDFYNGMDDDYDHMMNAMYKYHGAQNDDWHKERGISTFGPESQAYHTKNIHLPFENFSQWSGFPDNYLPGGQDTARWAIWSHRYDKAYSAALENLRARNPELDDNYLKEVAERAYRNHLPEGRKLDDNVNMEDPEERALLEADPLYQGWQQNGYTMRLHDFTHDLIHDIKWGRPNPYTQQMQQALAQQGHSPESIQNVMRQRWQWDPQAQQRIDLDPPQPQPPADPSLDQPGDLTLPEGWTSSTGRPRRAGSRSRSSRPGDAASRISSPWHPSAASARRSNSRHGDDGSPASRGSSRSVGPARQSSLPQTLSAGFDNDNKQEPKDKRPDTEVRDQHSPSHGVNPSGPRFLMQPSEARTCEHCLAPNRAATASKCWSCGHRLLEPPVASQGHLRGA